MHPVDFRTFVLAAALATVATAGALAWFDRDEVSSPDRFAFEDYTPGEFNQVLADPGESLEARPGEVGPTDFDQLAGSPETEARTVLFLLRATSKSRNETDRLTARLIKIFATKQDSAAEAPVVSFFLPRADAFTVLDVGSGNTTVLIVPLYDMWVSVMRDEPRPKRADEFLPNIKRIFAEEGVPEELAWIPEIESTFNPRARNRSGARGLFQLMPGTAREQGLRLWPHDERTNPEKSARAAAVFLRQLHDAFDSWPLALAAYNAGEGRVRRTLQARDATTFAEIAHSLPTETRLYVPRVLATLAVREGIMPGRSGTLAQIQ